MEKKSRFSLIKVFTDGGSRGNPGPAATAFIIKDNNGEIIFQKAEYIGRTTNNIAEYQAVIKALNFLVKKNFYFLKGGFSRILFFLDSQLVVNQLKGLYKIKNDKLKKLAIRAKDLEKKLLAKVDYFYISREKNFLADKLLNQALNKALFK